MVSKAKEDLPDPETPVTTVSCFLGMSTSMLRRLWVRAPRTRIGVFPKKWRRSLCREFVDVSES